MSKMDDILALRDGVLGKDVAMVEEGEKALVKRRRSASKKSTPKQKKVSWSDWMAAVEEEIEEVTGMEIDTFADLPWGKFYKNGLTPTQAVQDALKQVEDGEDEQEALSYKAWAKAVNKGLKKAEDLSIVEIKEAAGLTHREMHRVFMDNRKPSSAVEILLDIFNEGDDEKDSFVDSVDSGEEFGDETLSLLLKMFEDVEAAEVRVEDEFVPDDTPGFSPGTMNPGDFFGEDTVSVSAEVVPPSQGVPPVSQVAPAPVPPAPVPPTQSVMMEGMPSIESLMSRGGAPVVPSPVSTTGPIEEELNPVLPVDPMDIDEDIIGAALGTSDIGRTQPTPVSKSFNFSRFLPAVTVAMAIGPELAKAVSEGDVKYVFNKQSTTPNDQQICYVISLLEEDKKIDNFYLGFSYIDEQGSEEEGGEIVTKWTVSLTKGRTREEAEEVMSEAGVLEENLESITSALLECFGS